MPFPESEYLSPVWKDGIFSMNPWLQLTTSDCPDM